MKLPLVLVSFAIAISAFAEEPKNTLDNAAVENLLNQWVEARSNRDPGAIRDVVSSSAEIRVTNPTNREISTLNIDQYCEQLVGIWERVNDFKFRLLDKQYELAGRTCSQRDRRSESVHRGQNGERIP